MKLTDRKMQLLNSGDCKLVIMDEWGDVMDIDSWIDDETGKPPTVERLMEFICRNNESVSKVYCNTDELLAFKPNLPIQILLRQEFDPNSVSYKMGHIPNGENMTDDEKWEYLQRQEEGAKQ